MKLQIKKIQIPFITVRQKNPTLQAYFSILIADRDSLIEINRCELHNVTLKKIPEPWIELPSMRWTDKNGVVQVSPFVEIDIDMKNKVTKEVFEQWSLASRKAGMIVEQAVERQHEKKIEQKRKDLEERKKELAENPDDLISQALADSAKDELKELEEKNPLEVLKEVPKDVPWDIEF